MSKQTEKAQRRLIADNRKARHDYTFEDQFEAGLVLEGWELKSLRSGKAQLKESYVKLIRGEAWLIGSHIAPLSSASTHVQADPTRTRKLLLHEKEINKLQKAISQKGFTVVPVNLHWSHSRVKLDIAIAKGKQLHDKRSSEKDRDWQREKQQFTKRLNG